MRTVAPAGQSYALSLRKKVSKGDRMLKGGSSLHGISSRVFFTSLPPSTPIQTTGVAFGEKVQRSHGQSSRWMRS